MARNYILDAINAYGKTADILRQGRLDEERREDRKTKQAEHTEDRAYQKQARERQGKQWGAEDTAKDAAAEMVSSIFGEDLAQKDEMGYRKAIGLAKDPDKLVKTLSISDEIIGLLSEGKMPSGDLVAGYMNYVGRDELLDRAEKQGLQNLEVDKVVPSPSGGVMINFTATDKSGKKYQAPMTTGASAKPGDDTVEELSVEQLLGWLGGSRDAAKKLMIAQVRAGDMTTLNKYRAIREGIINKKQELATYEEKKKIDKKYKTTGEWKQAKDGTWEYLTPDRSGKVKGKLPKGTEDKEIPASVQKMMMEDAEKIAKEEASEKAGWFSRDKTDFPGGRKKWVADRAMEIYNDMVQKRKGGKAGTASAEGMGTKTTPKKVKAGTKLDRGTATQLMQQALQEVGGNKAKAKARAREIAKELGYEIPTTKAPPTMKATH